MAAALLGALLIMTAGCARSESVSISDSAVPDMPRYAPSDEYIRQQNIVKRHLAAVKLHKAQKRRELEMQEAIRRAARWEKLRRVLRAAKFGRKENL